MATKNIAVKTDVEQVALNAAFSALHSELKRDARKIEDNRQRINVVQTDRLNLRQALAKLWDVGIKDGTFYTVKRDLDNQHKGLTTEQNYLKKRFKYLCSVRDKIHNEIAG